jgi:hypothetical protein
MKKLLLLAASFACASAFATGSAVETQSLSTSTTSTQHQDSTANNQIGCLVNCASTDAGQTANAAALVMSTQLNSDAAKAVATINANAAKDITKTNGETARAVASTTQTIKNVPSVSASALTSSNDTCMGSASGSVNGPGFGLSLGKTYTDSNCVMLKNGRELWNMGMKAAAMALMCSDTSNREALESTGYQCPQTKHDQKSMQTTENVSTGTNKTLIVTPASTSPLYY